MALVVKIEGFVTWMRSLIEKIRANTTNGVALVFMKIVSRGVLVHLTSILSLIIIPSIVIFLLDHRWGPGEEGKAVLLRLFLQATTGVVFILLPPVYMEGYWLIPRYLGQKRYIAFFLGNMLVISACGIFAGYFEPWMDAHWFDQPQTTVQPLYGVMTILLVVVLTTLVSLSYRWFTQLSKIRQMENDQLKKELLLLKNQINPHFFFNTLNNLYALSLEHSARTPEVILKLSELMRYTIYECKAPFVPLSKEVKYLENYIALQQIRQHDDHQIVFNQRTDAMDIQVAPMLFIVLVENAFKHGVDDFGQRREDRH